MAADRLQETLSDRKRKAILQAALDAFRHEGFGSTSMDKIAERAGVSKRTLYNHFSSKDALFDAVTDGFWSRVGELPVAPLVAGVGVEERLLVFAQLRLSLLLDPQMLGLFRAVLAESMRQPDLGRAWRREAPHLETLGVREVFREEIERNTLKIDDLDLAAQHFWGLVFEGLFWPIVLFLKGPASNAERDRYAREGIRTFLARYGTAQSIVQPLNREEKLEPAETPSGE